MKFFWSVPYLYAMLCVCECAHTHRHACCKVGNHSQGQPEGFLFNSYYTKVWGGSTSFPGLLHFTLDMYLIMLNVKQGGIISIF